VQGGQRGEDGRVLGVLVTGRVERGDGVLGPLLPHVGPGQGGVRGHGRGTTELGLGGQHRDQGLVVAGRLGGPPQRPEGDRIPPVEREGLAPAPQGVGVLTEALVQGGRGLERVRGEPWVGQRAGEEDLHPQEAGHVPVCGEHSLGLDQESKVCRLELERVGEHRGGLVPPVEAIGQDLGLLEEERGAGPVALGGRQLGVEELEHHRPVPDVGEDAPGGTEVLDEPGR
jgi:hypothetical protein